MPNSFRFYWSSTAALLAIFLEITAQADYKLSPDDGPWHVEVIRDTWVDTARARREVPVLLYLPKALREPAPVVLFSHGLGGSREGYAYLGRYWASHGYISVHLQHAGSDDGVWRGLPVERAYKAMYTAAQSPTVALHRAKDLPFVLDELERRNTDEQSPLHGQFDMERVGLAGHSFGAWSALVGGGQQIISPSGRKLELADPRVKAIIPLSAPVPLGPAQRRTAYDGIRVPALHMTATLDDSPIGRTKVEDRRVPFDQTPTPDRGGADSYLLIFNGGDHMTFAGTPKRRTDATQRRNDRTFHPLIRRTTLAFLDAYLRGQTDAEAWLQDGGLAESLGKHASLEMKVD